MSAQFLAPGWHPRATAVCSPNYDARPAGIDIELIVIHAISLPPGEFGGPHVKELFTNTLDCDAHPYFSTLRETRVSSHFYIDRGGQLTQFVDTAERAWHAGESEWQGRDRCNDFSIGIELEGDDDSPYTDAQYEMLGELLADLRRQYQTIAEDAIVGHCDIAPSRKTDPGPHFDWGRIGLNRTV